MTNEEAVKMLRTIQRTVYLGNRKFEDAIECAIKALSEPLQPWEVLAAQAVLPQPEIIYCKDCKHYDPIYAHNGGVCEHWNAKTEEDVYCGYAERKEE